MHWFLHRVIFCHIYILSYLFSAQSTQTHITISSASSDYIVLYKSFTLPRISTIFISSSSITYHTITNGQYNYNSYDNNYNNNQDNVCGAITILRVPSGHSNECGLAPGGRQVTGQAANLTFQFACGCHRPNTHPPPSALLSATDWLVIFIDFIVPQRVEGWVDVGIID